MSKANTASMFYARIEMNEASIEPDVQWKTEAEALNGDPFITLSSSHVEFANAVNRRIFLHTKNSFLRSKRSQNLSQRQ